MRREKVHVVDPLDPGSIAAGLGRILTEDRSSARGHFSWEATARPVQQAVARAVAA